MVTSKHQAWLPLGHRREAPWSEKQVLGTRWHHSEPSCQKAAVSSFQPKLERPQRSLRKVGGQMGVVGSMLRFCRTHVPSWGRGRGLPGPLASERGVRVTSPLAPEVGRLDHGKNHCVRLCPRFMLDKMSFGGPAWLRFKTLKTGPFVSVWLRLPGSSLPQGHPSALGLCWARRLDRTFLRSRCGFLAPRRHGSFNKAGYCPQGEA